MTLEERIYNGDQAKLVLENEAFAQAFTDIEQELTQAWKTSPQRDEAGREKLFQALTMLNKVKFALQTSLDTGKLAVLELNHLNPTMQNKARDYLGLDPL